MATIIIDGVMYCLELSPDEDNGDDTNKPSPSSVKDANPWPSLNKKVEMVR